MLAEKGVPYETVTVDLENRPAWLLEHNPPNGRVPVLEEDGWVLPESAVIDEYLDERFPEPPLLPVDPAERAAARLVVFRFDDLGKPYYACRRQEPGADAVLAGALGSVDAFLASTPFLTGRSFGLADIAYLPWLFRLRDLMGVTLDPYPSLSRLGGHLRRTAVRLGRDRDRRLPRGVSDVTTAELAGRLASRVSCSSTCASRRSSRGMSRRRATHAGGTSLGATPRPRRLSRRRARGRPRARRSAGRREVIAYCHSGSRSAIAAHVLSAAGYVARNYVGSWHEWSRDPELPGETGA